MRTDASVSINVGLILTIDHIYCADCCVLWNSTVLPFEEEAMVMKDFIAVGWAEVGLKMADSVIDLFVYRKEITACSHVGFIWKGE